MKATYPSIDGTGKTGSWKGSGRECLWEKAASSWLRAPSSTMTFEPLRAEIRPQTS